MLSTESHLRDALNKIEFICKDVSEMNTLKFKNKLDITHVYSFNMLLSQENNEKLKSLIAKC